MPSHTTYIGLKKSVAKGMARADRDADAGQKNHRRPINNSRPTLALNHNREKKEENKISAEFDMQGAGTLIEIVISILHFCSWALPMFHAQSIIANCVFKTLANFPPSPRTGLPAHTPQQ